MNISYVMLTRVCARVCEVQVFIKPHACNDKVKALVREHFKSRGIRVMSEVCVYASTSFGSGLCLYLCVWVVVCLYVFVCVCMCMNAFVCVCGEREIDRDERRVVRRKQQMLNQIWLHVDRERWTQRRLIVSCSSTRTTVLLPPRLSKCHPRYQYIHITL
jgi:hypothetical protein